jgi:DNA-binding response OmpR family regulator
MDARSYAPAPLPDGGQLGSEAGAIVDREAALLDALRSSGRRVVTRRELARAAGLREHPRRVDVHLVNVRRSLSDEELINVRGRGWMLVPVAAS